MYFTNQQKAYIAKESILQAENRSDDEMQNMMDKKRKYREQLLEQIRQNQERKVLASRAEDKRSKSIEQRARGIIDIISGQWKISKNIFFGF